jgi:hypothetical protein
LFLYRAFTFTSTFISSLTDYSKFAVPADYVESLSARGGKNCYMRFSPFGAQGASDAAFLLI